MKKRAIISLMAALTSAALFTGCSFFGNMPDGGKGAQETGSAADGISGEGDPSGGSGDKSGAEGSEEGKDASKSAGETDAKDRSAPQPAAAQQADAPENPVFVNGIAIVNHELETVEKYRFQADGEKYPYARAAYPQIILSREMKRQYPRLDSALQAVNLEKKAYAYYQLSQKAMYASELLGELPSYLDYESTYEISRCDSRVFAYVDTEYDDMGGAHPNTVIKTAVFDLKSGNALEIRDVLTDMKDMAEHILDRLYCVADKSYQFTDESQREMLGIISSEIRDSSIKWVLDEEGISFYFSPYELNSYSLGVLRADFSYVELADIIRGDLGLPGEKIYVRHFGDEDVVRLPVSDLERYSAMDEDNLDIFSEIFERRSEAKPDLTDAIKVANPGWEYYISSEEEVSDPAVEVKKLTERKSDWLDEEQWSRETGIDLPPDFPYVSGGYSFDRFGEEGWYLRVAPSNASDEDASGSPGQWMKEEMVYDLSEFMEPDSRSDDMFAQYADMRIIHAEIYDRILYLSIGHRTYASSQPHTAFMVAISMEDGSVLWRSEDQLSNSGNFLVGEDTIITGYGFTDEPDYMYILNRQTGKVISTTKLNTGPDYFIPLEDGTMYVLTYNTVYVFDVKQ